MSYRTEFPDYPAADMPAEVAAWEDISWHNDSCPCFVPCSNLTVWIDYANPAQREWAAFNPARFSIIATDDEGCLLNDIGQQALLHTDNWVEVLMFVSNAMNERA